MVKVAITGVTPQNGTGYVANAPPDFSRGNQIEVDCLLFLSGNYGTANSHGDAVDFTNLVDPVTQAAAGPPFSFGDYAPADWTIKELLVAGTAPLGYLYNYCPGPTLAAPTQKGGVLQIIGTGTGSQDGGNEITQGAAYSAQSPSLAGVTLKARFTFVRL